MKIALAQLNYHIGNFEANTNKIISSIHEAREQGAELVVFGELSVCGYPPRDFLEFDDFLKRCEKSVQEIAKHCTDIAAVVGAPSVNPKVEGKNLFNSAYFLSDGKITSVHHKALLPTYDVFDEYRYFEPATAFQCLTYKNTKIALTICEDIWDVEDDLMYTRWPMEELIKESPDLMINIAASPFSHQHPAKRREVMKKNVARYQLPLIYVQHVGAQTELIFDGGSMALSAAGKIVNELPYFSEALSIIATDNINELQENLIALNKYELIEQALILGIKDYFNKMGFTKAILGLSGGVDSALVVTLAVKALGKENILPVLLPSSYSSDHSVNDSIELCKNLGCRYEKISIADGYDTMLKTLQPIFGDAPFNIAEENIQSRLRAVILMGIANKHGYILLNTTNKSEAAVGYGTLYGDMCGGIAVIGDLYKTEVYELCRYINRNEIVIPENILTKAPSAELRPNQKDSDSLPEYDILDALLYQYIEQRQGPQELVKQGFDTALVQRVLKMVNSNEWKRAQAPPILRVSYKAFGSGRRLPIVGKYLG